MLRNWSTAISVFCGSIGGQLCFVLLEIIEHFQTGVNIKILETGVFIIFSNIRTGVNIQNIRNNT